MQAPEAPRRPPIQSACLLKSFEEVRGKAPHIYAHLSIEAVRELAKDMVEDEKVTADQLVAHYGCMSENEKLYMAAKAAIPLSTDKASFYKWTELFYKAVSDD